MQVSLVEVGDGRRQHVLIEADPESSAGDVAAALRSLRPGDLLLDGRLFAGPDRLASSGVHDGAVLQVVPPGSAVGATADAGGRPAQGGQAAWEVAVVSGAQAGIRAALPAGDLLIGRDPTAQFRLDHSSVSRLHARLSWPAGRSRLGYR